MSKAPSSAASSTSAKTQKEDPFVRKVTGHLRTKLKSAATTRRVLKNISVSNHIQIASDFTIIPSGGKFTPTLGSSEQDIVFHLNPEWKKFPLPNGIKKASGSLVGGYSVIPLSIFEVKLGSPITHAIAQYARMAEKIRSIFPFARYYFLDVINSNKVLSDEKAWRQAKTFAELIRVSGNAAQVADLVLDIFLSDLPAFQRQKII